MERTHETLKDAVNRALRAGLASQEAQETASATRPPFTVHAHPSQFLPGLDRDKMNQLADELDTEEFLRRTEGRRS
jgi:hypothetical protein